MNLRFLHIPKTAGNTFTGCLVRLYGPCFRFAGDLSADLQRFRSLRDGDRDALRVIAGHAPRITGEPDVDGLPTITFLRDPVERVKSFCQHVSEGKSPHLRHTFPPETFRLDAFLASGTLELDNFQTRVLLGRQSFDVDMRDTSHAATMALAALHDLTGFGIVERFDASLMLFRDQFGWRWPLYRSTNHKNPRRVLLFTDAHLERIRELTIVDRLVYEEARRHFDDMSRNTREQLAQDLQAFRRVQDTATARQPLPGFIRRIAQRPSRSHGASVSQGVFASQVPVKPPWSPAAYEEKIRSREPLYARPIHYGQDGHDVVRRQLERPGPWMVSRLGCTELSCLGFFLDHRRSTNRPYPSFDRADMSNYSGFFPTDDAHLDRFSELFLGHIESVDVMGVWFNPYEDVVCNARCPAASLVEFGCLEPFRFQTPWSSRLRGKTVLVVHPFADSIARQYRERRPLLFADQDVLPEFELKTIKAVQSVVDTKVGFATWFDAFDHMCLQISAVEFDVAIIGAGAFGLPLASFVKRQGKQAIHLGGVTQILFGIKGRRWETYPYDQSIGRLFNEYWIRPSAAERPTGYLKNGADYW